MKHVDTTQMRLKLAAIVQSAGLILLQHFRSPSLRTSQKDDQSPVTNADLLSETLILRELRMSYPSIPIVSEEQKESQNRIAMGSEFFLVDPLDSTKNYVNGIPVFDVTIAYVKDGSPIVAVVHDPIHGVTYSSTKTNGAFANDKPIRCRECPSISTADLDLNVPRLDQRTYERIMLRLAPQARKVRYFGSAVLEICWIASGYLDAIINHPLSNWDIAGATLILEEAGGVWGDLDGTKYRMDSLTKRSILAAGDSRLVHELLRVLHIYDD